MDYSKIIRNIIKDIKIHVFDWKLDPYGSASDYDITYYLDIKKIIKFKKSLGDEENRFINYKKSIILDMDKFCNSDRLINIKNDTLLCNTFDDINKLLLEYYKAINKYYDEPQDIGHKDDYMELEHVSFQYSDKKILNYLKNCNKEIIRDQLSNWSKLANKIIKYININYPLFWRYDIDYNILKREFRNLNYHLHQDICGVPGKNDLFRNACKICRTENCFDKSI
ncbi:hypothetical protein [Alphaentomopoxvirus acuprea]|uniref:Uncharacterized protein n=1 Tax=Alphaentomopoxvirus acuprea TaxID=62099 RepID=W6JIQ3_9POXV|nr:hypothetical protein BA82_gp072 [Anomala cuprea entomopoxvirus]BAO49432.1 hypothetical protein [Anomala cuprea entomopoxvirus]